MVSSRSGSPPSTKRRVGGGRGRDAHENPLAGQGMATVEGADPDREDDVVGRLAGLEDEVLCRNMAEGQAAGSNSAGCVGAGLVDGLGGTG